MVSEKEIRSKHSILVVSNDPVLADVRKQKLEAAGFEVLAANNVIMLRSILTKRTVDLIMIGYLLPPAEKRRARVEATDLCGTQVPILELYIDAEHEFLNIKVLEHLSKTKTTKSFLANIVKIIRDGDIERTS